jgi:hypothetical protein
MSLQYIANQQLMTVELGLPYVAGSGTMTLNAGEGALLPATGVFWIRQSNVYASTMINILKVTARTGDVLTVVGGQDGTFDQNIAAGVVMTWSLTVSALTQLVTDILAQSAQQITVYAPGNQSAAVASGNLATGLAAGEYQVSAFIQVPNANATDLFLSINIGYTFLTVAGTRVLVNSFNLVNTNSHVDAVAVLRVDAASAITREITVSGAGSYNYNPVIVLSKIG